MGRFLLGFAAGLMLLPALAFLYVYFGYAPVATAAPALPLERKITSMALHARIEKEAPKQPGAPATEENLTAGARTYLQYCAVCHGLSGQPPTPTSKGMF